MCAMSLNPPKPLTVSVNYDRLQRFDDIARPEAERLAREAAAKIEESLPTIAESEVVLVSITGLEAMSRLREYSDVAVGTNTIRRWIPEYIVRMLNERGIFTEAALVKNYTIREPKTQLIVRTFLEQDEKSYGPDFRSNTYSYQRSILHVFVRRAQPPESVPVAVPELVVVSQEPVAHAPEVPVTPVTKKPTRRWFFW